MGTNHGNQSDSRTATTDSTPGPVAAAAAAALVLVDVCTSVLHWLATEENGGLLSAGLKDKETVELLVFGHSVDDCCRPSPGLA